MGLITLKEYAGRHGKNPIVVRQKALRGGFTTAQKLGRDWFIDEDEPYEDRRIKTGDYIDWRKKFEKNSKKPETPIDNDSPE